MKYTNEESLTKQTSIQRTRSANKILRKAAGTAPANATSGEVVSIIGNQLLVESSISGATAEIPCVCGGTIISKSRHWSTLLATGDNVLLLHNKAGLSKIVSVATRKTKFSRVDPSNRNREQIIAANVDTLLIFASILEPAMNSRLIDRYLVAANISHIQPIICINKTELCADALTEQALAPYAGLGVSVFCISALTGAGVACVASALAGRRTVISGVSGAGKSTFLNALLGYPAAAVRDISVRTSKGTHTTSFSKRYRLPGGGFIIDTPGLREFGIWDLGKDEVGVVFPDFIGHYLHCKFTSCTHTSEPGCAVIRAVEQGEISEERYLSYLNIYDTL